MKRVAYIAGKSCSRCGERKPLDDFHPRKDRPGGRASHCKDCDSKRNQRASKVESNKAWAKANPDRRAEYGRRDRERHPEKVRARKLLSRAIATGSVVRQPCKVCGTSPAEGHHVDYTKPLDVQWLCTAHHPRGLRA